MRAYTVKLKGMCYIAGVMASSYFEAKFQAMIQYGISMHHIVEVI